MTFHPDGELAAEDGSEALDEISSEGDVTGENGESGVEDGRPEGSEIPGDDALEGQPDVEDADVDLEADADEQPEVACSGGLTLCGGVCVDTDADPLNCGSCGRQCRSDQYCSEGNCVCRPSLTPCGSNCVDVETNVNHCGACSNPCTEGPGSEIYCSDGACTATPCDELVPQAEFCDPRGRSCVPLESFASDPLNCGGCGVRCDRNEVCVAGTCILYYPAAGCSSCPCAACTAPDICCTFPGVEGFLICVGAETCPG